GAFERLQPHLELRQARASALEHPGLGVELVAGYQVELAEARAQHGPEVGFEVLLHGAERRRYAFEKPAGDLINPEAVHHLSPRARCPPMGRSRRCAAPKQCVQRPGGGASAGKRTENSDGMDSAPRLPASPA